jgi:hypothetical protein
VNSWAEYQGILQPFIHAYVTVINNSGQSLDVAADDFTLYDASGDTSTGQPPAGAPEVQSLATGYEFSSLEIVFPWSDDNGSPDIVQWTIDGYSGESSA